MARLHKRFRRLCYRFGMWRFDRAEYKRDLSYLKPNFLDTLQRETKGTARPLAGPRGIAIVAVYPMPQIVFSIRNLCAALSENGFWVLMVASTTLKDEMRGELLPSCQMLLERTPVGRDFGSYKMGLLWLNANGGYADAESLILTNDSMYWPRSFGNELATMLNKDEPWQGLFEHLAVFPVQRHVQSFFLLFGSSLFNSSEFQDYWRNFSLVPVGRSMRKHLIRKGELGLSQRLLAHGWRPAVAYNIQRILDELIKRLQSDPPDKSVLLTLTNYGIELPAQNYHYGLMEGVTASKNLGFDPSSHLLNNVVESISQRMQSGNPTHTIGLLCNTLLDAPIKRDIPLRGTHNIGTFLMYLKGFDDSERRMICGDLSERGTRLQWDRFWLFLEQRGRI
jgi:hypothetical protein